jgi:hypothetical protein
VVDKSGRASGGDIDCRNRPQLAPRGFRFRFRVKSYIDQLGPFFNYSTPSRVSVRLTSTPWTIPSSRHVSRRLSFD